MEVALSILQTCWVGVDVKKGSEASLPSARKYRRNTIAHFSTRQALGKDSAFSVNKHLRLHQIELVNLYLLSS